MKLMALPSSLNGSPDGYQLAELNQDTEAPSEPSDPPLDERITVESLHAHREPPARPTPAERPPAPAFVRAEREAGRPRQAPGLNW